MIFYIDMNAKFVIVGMVLNMLGDIIHFCPFELNPSDGTRYTVDVYADRYGGYNAIVNNKSCYRIYLKGEIEIKHLFGDQNEYTKEALRIFAQDHFTITQMISLNQIRGASNE